MPNSKCRESFFKSTLLIIFAVICLLSIVLMCYNAEVQAAETKIEWKKQDGVLSWYLAGKLNKYAPVDVQPSDLPKNYVKQAGTYNQCISTNGAKRYVLTTNDCYNKPLSADVVYCPVIFCIKSDGTMALTLPASTYTTCDKLYFDKLKLVSVFDSSTESIYACK